MYYKSSYSFFSLSCSHSFLYFYSLKFFSLSPLLCIGCQIFEYNEIYLKCLITKLDFNIVPLASNKISLKVTTFNRLVVVSSIHKYINNIKSCSKFNIFKRIVLGTFIYLDLLTVCVLLN